MLYATVSKDDAGAFLKRITHGYNTYGPKRKGGRYLFEHLEGDDDIALDYPTTDLPPKKFFLPPREVLFNYEYDKDIKLGGDKTYLPKVLFGLHSCDIWALNLLDLVFGKPFEDNYYAERRRNAIIIGTDCTPSETCFCKSMGTDQVYKGFDLFLSDIGDKYLARIVTAAGDHLLRRNAQVGEVSPEDLDRYRKHVAERAKSFSLEINIRNLPDFLDLAYDHPVWDELGEKCLGCGSCTFVCPTCYCFYVSDEMGLDLKQGQRLRHWDSCLFVNFAKVAGGFNFRPGRADRYKLRFYHKEKGFVEDFGRSACVGCGRCIRSCLAKIDVTEVIERVQNPQQKQESPVQS